MPSPNPTTRREYKGAAKATTLSAQIVNGSDTSFTITDATGWPTGATGKFVVTINAGQSDEEKILCTSRTGTTVTVDTRGYDSTTAAGHASGATATHTYSAVDADEANAHTAASTGVHGVAGSVVGTSDSQTLTNKTLTAPSISNPALSGTTTGLSATSATLDAASTHGGVSGTSLAADRTAWTSYTPTFTNCTGPTGNFYYKQIGKTLLLRWEFTGGTATTTAAVTFTLPAGNTSAAVQGAYSHASASSSPVSLSITAGGSALSATGGILSGHTLSTDFGYGSAVIEVA